jgi:hypothetical protein
VDATARYRASVSNDIGVPDPSRALVPLLRRADSRSARLVPTPFPPPQDPTDLIVRGLGLRAGPPRRSGRQVALRGLTELIVNM